MIIDGGSAHTSDEFEKFVIQASSLGVIFHKSNHARANPAERLVATFQTRICNGRRFYVGDSIKSTREPSKPASEVIALYRDKKSLITEEELDLEFYTMIEQFCEEKF